MTNEHTKVDIYFSDLNKDKQEELLEAYSINSPDEANWGVYPITTIEVYDIDEI